MAHDTGEHPVEAGRQLHVSAMEVVHYGEVNPRNEVSVMDDTIRKMVDLGVGLMSFSREKITESAKQWAEKRKLTPEQTRALIEELVARGEQGRTELQNNIQDQVQKALERLGLREQTAGLEHQLASIREAVTRLAARVEVLESKLGQPEPREESATTTSDTTQS
ncbi:hypothetical protein N007_14240 [Alicyclobacillus acidoterrestris ATCC 49025]|nr:hypothetical protein N007_14240 [Alicyclobacillus acidoterrestris ATCC 49025]